MIEDINKKIQEEYNKLMAGSPESEKDFELDPKLFYLAQELQKELYGSSDYGDE